MHQAKQKYCEPRVYTEAKLFETADILEGLVHYRESDDSVNQKRVYADATQHTNQQRGTMANRKEAHIKRNIAQSKQEKNYPCQKQQVVITRDHVFSTKIHVGDELQASDAFEVTRILLGDSMRKYGLGQCTHCQENQC